MVIETKRLILRPFLETDAGDVYEYLREPAVNCFADMKLHSPDEAKKEMTRRSGEGEFYFAIALKDSGKVIGEIGAYPEAGEPHADADAVRDTFSPLWMLNENYQGRGYAFEAARAFFSYLFSQKGAIDIRIDRGLQSSQPAPVRKAGDAPGGRVPRICLLCEQSGRYAPYENTVQYAILKKEWEQNQSGQAQTEGRAFP